MLTHHGSRWGDKVRIIGISIDQTAEAVVKHVKAKKWEKVDHFHRAGSSADEDYGVKGVPHVVLIDTHGKIVYIGHPASRDLEKDIETLLKGDTLKGISGGAGDDDEEDDGTGYTERDLDSVGNEMLTFKDLAHTKLQKDGTLKGFTPQLMRDFTVLVRESIYDTTKEKILTKFENINVLVGPQVAVDKAKAAIESFLAEVKGSFTTSWRV